MNGWIAPINIADPPLIYFARAVDGEDRLAALSLADRVAAELAPHGLMLVDPVRLYDAGPGDDQPSEVSIVEHDLRILRRCDAILMDMSIQGRNYIGCSCELTYAYLWKIPCVVYLGGATEIRPWLTYHATAVAQTRGQAIRKLLSVLKMDG